MLKMSFDHGDWILVCDGARALILENAGDEKFPNLRTREAIEEPHESTRLQGADACAWLSGRASALRAAEKDGGSSAGGRRRQQ